jgi:type II secretory pathway pseudopilin PulG
MTLLEALVALVILAMGLSAILQATGTSVRATRRAEATREALVIAESLLTTPLEARAVDGLTTRGHHGGWQWQRRALPLSGSDSRPRAALVPVLIAVDVRGPDGTHVTLSTLFALPDVRTP